MLYRHVRRIACDLQRTCPPGPLILAYGLALSATPAVAQTDMPT